MMANIVTPSHELACLDVPLKDEVERLRPMGAEAQIAAVTGILGQSRFGLQVAIAAQNLPGIMEWKAKASAIQDLARQLQLGKDMQLDAAEFLRRAERGLGVAIRGGQARGEIRRGGQSDTYGNAWVTSQPLTTRSGPNDFASQSELHGANLPRTGIYAMTDGVTNEAFEAALAEARQEANLSRANVARKAREQSKPDPVIDADPCTPVRKTARGRKTVQGMAIDLHGWAAAIIDIDPAEVPTDEVAQEIKSISESMCSIRKFMKAVEDA